MQQKIAWFLSGLILMAVVGFGIMLWYKNATKPIIVPYVSPSPTLPVHNSADSISTSMTPSITPSGSSLAIPAPPVVLITSTELSDTPEPSLSVSPPFSLTPSPSVFPRH